MPRQDVPYGGAICSLKERIAEIWDKLGEKLHSINGVEGDGAGDVKLVSGDAAVVISSDRIGHKIEVGLDKSKLPSGAVSSVNGKTGAVRLDAADIPSDENSNVQADIDGVQAAIDAEASARASAVSAEATARQDADSALGARIDALGSASGKDVGTSSGQVPILGSNGKLDNSVIPALAISQYLGVVASAGALTGLTGQMGDYAVVSGTSAASGTYIISDNDGSSASDWVRISGPTDITAGDGIVVSGSVVGLASSGVTAGSKGSAVQIPTVTVDQYGRVTALGGATVYPPTTAGTSGQVWRSDGSGAGAWETPDTAPTASSSRLVTSGAVKAAIDAEAEARAKAMAKAMASIDVETQTRANADTALGARIDAALPASTPQVYIATIPQTDYLDVCLVQYVRIGPDKGLLSFSGHMRDIGLPDDVWTLISIDTVMSAMGLTHKRPSSYRATGWWHYDDGDDHGDMYGSGTVCQVSPAGGLELGRFYSGTQIGNWQMSNLGRDRYITVRDVYVEIQSDTQHTHALSAAAAVPGSQHSFRVHQSYL